MGVTLHYPTVGLIIGIVSVVTTLVMLMVWAVNPRERGTSLWALAAAMAAVGFFVLRLGPQWGSTVTFINNSLALTANLLIMEGILRFRGFGDPAFRTRLYVPLVLIFVVLSFVNQDMAARRYLFHDLFQIVICSTSALALVWRTRGLERRVQGLTALFFIAFAGVFALRWGLAASGDIGASSQGHPIMGPVFLAAMLWMMGWTYGLSVAVNLRARRQIEHLVRHDGLTNLYNRSALEGRFVEATAIHRRSGRTFGLVVIDLDGFKALNDGQGHVFGDHVLRAFAARLRELLRETDLAARTGGDEFVVLLQDVPTRAALDIALERLKQGLNGPLAVQGRRVILRASLGAALCPEDGTTLDAVTTAADAAMYRDKATAVTKTLVED